MSPEKLWRASHSTSQTFLRTRLQAACMLIALNVEEPARDFEKCRKLMAHMPCAGDDGPDRISLALLKSLQLATRPAFPPLEQYGNEDR